MSRPALAGLFLVIAIGAISAPTSAQTNPNLEVGLKPYGSYDSTDFDSVSIANGNVFLHIPLLSYPQRGSLPEKIYIVANNKNFYVSQICNPKQGTCTSQWRWGFNTDIATPPGPGPGVNIVSQNFVSSHNQFVSPNNWVTVYTWDGTGHQMAQVSGLGQRPFDGSGLLYTLNPISFVDRTGNFIGSEDPNGNYFSIVTGPPSAEYDTMGRNLFPSGSNTTDYTGCVGPLPTVLSGIANYPGVNGGVVQIKTCYANGTVNTNFNGYDYDPYSNRDHIQEVQTTVQFLQTVIVYDGNSWATSPKWSFVFDAGLPGDTSTHYGDLLTVGLPTGGSISYTWSNGGFCGGHPRLVSESRMLTSRTENANDGTGPHTTTYAIIPSQSVVTDPMGNDTVHVATGLGGSCSYFDTEVDYYQGSHTTGTLLKKVTTNYQYQPNPFDHIGDGTTTTVTNVFPTQITTIWPNGQQSQVQYTYDANLTAEAPAVTGGANYTMSYGKLMEEREYDYANGAPGPLLRRKDYTYQAFNNSSYLAADMIDRVASETVYNGSGSQVAQTTYGYDEYAVQTTSTPQHGAPPNSVRGNRTSIKRWLNTTGGTLNTTTTYFDTGMPDQVTDPKGNVTTYAYSPTYDGAYLTQTTMPATGSVQHIVSATYDYNSGRVASFTDQNGQVSNYQYDVLWRPILGSYPDGGQTTIQYPDLQTIEVQRKITSSLSTDNFVYFDGLARTKQTKLNSDPDGPDYTDTTYDADGRISTVSNPYRSTSDPTYGITTYNYDALDRTTSVTDPDRSVISTSYPGNSTTVTDEAGHTRESFTDGAGRMTQVIENPGGLNYTTAYTYDALDNLTGVTQAGSRPRTFVYDSLSRLTSATNPESGAMSYTYDADSNVATKTDARAITTTYTYDALNRLTQKTYSDGTTPRANFYYDQTTAWGGGPISNPIGRMITEYTFDGGGNMLTTNLFEYDPMGRVSIREQCQPQGCAADPSLYALYLYDLIGNPTSLEVGQQNNFNFTISYGYNLAGRPTGITSTLVDSQHPATLMSGIHYNAAGSMIAASYGNALTETAAYNPRLQPCRANVNSSGTLLGSCTDAVPSGNLLDLNYGFNYGSGDNGNVMSWAAAGNQTFNRSYTYDALNRLSTMASPGSGCSGLSWTYDAWGNRTDQTVTGGSCTTFHASVSANNQLTGAPYQYDAAGNMIHDASHSYTYDAENRLTAVDGGSTASYIYDAEGHRVVKTTASGWNDYLYDASGNVVAQTIATSWGPGYVYLGSQLVAQYSNSTTYFVHRDHLGSARLLTAMDKSVYDSMDYLPFGEQIAGSSGTTHKFTGKERDTESGLDNFGARYNASSMGRFMTPDPLLNSGRPWEPQTWNRYAYARNNPLNIVDPTGLYDLVNNCATDDTKCNKQFRQHADDLKKGLSNLQKKADKMKDGPEKQRLEASLKVLGTEGDHNGVGATFGAVEGGAAETTFNTNENNQLSATVTFDPSKISSSNDYGIDAAHEGTHIEDMVTGLVSALISHSSLPELGPFSTEYRGYQTSAWAAQALGLPNISFRGVQIWNSSWAAADRQTLQDRAITNVVVDKDHPETTPHNPWPN